jgi:DNA-binding CsgD family transcriptional regulator
MPFMRFTLFFLFPILSFGQDLLLLKKGVEKQEIKEHTYVLKDLSNRLTINDLLGEKAKYFEKSKVEIPNFGWGKRTGWVKFEIQFSASKNYLLHINSAIFDDLSFYVVDNKMIVQQYESLSFKTPVEARPYPHRDFVFPLKLTKGKPYIIYLKGKSLLNTNKFPLTIWEEKNFEKNDRRANFFWGIIIGIFVLIALGNFVIGFLLKMRIFHYYGMYVIGIVLIFFHLEGYLYEYLPIKFFRNGIFDLTQYFTYGIFFWNILFVMSFTKLSLANQPIFERIIRILILIYWILLVHSILSPLWRPYASDYYLQAIGWTGRVFLIAAIAILYLTVFASIRQNSISLIYLISAIPPTLSYLLAQYFNHIFDFWIVQPYAYLTGFLLEIIILSIAMIFRVKEYLFTKLKIENSIQSIDSQIVNKVMFEKKDIISKREIEIITAFAKGFTYQDISDAMFISPHTVRTHIKNIYQKLDINSKAEAVKVAIEQGWI